MNHRRISVIHIRTILDDINLTVWNGCGYSVLSLFILFSLFPFSFAVATLGRRVGWGLGICRSNSQSSFGTPPPQSTRKNVQDIKEGVHL